MGSSEHPIARSRKRQRSYEGFHAIVKKEVIEPSEHEMVECAPDLEIELNESPREKSYSSLPPPPPPPSSKYWKTKSTCTVCGKVYSNYHNMMRHYKTHDDNEKNISCEHCDEKFRLRGHLKEHLIVEHGVMKPQMFYTVQKQETPENNDVSINTLFL